MKFFQMGFPLILAMQNDKKLAYRTPLYHLSFIVILNPLNYLHYSTSIDTFDQLVIHHKMELEYLQQFC
jgi:hypothetical protein